MNFQWEKSYTWVPKNMNTGCPAEQFWAYRRTKKVAGAPRGKFISLIQTFFSLANSLLFISAMISNDTMKIIELSLLLRHFQIMFRIMTASTQAN